MIIQRYIAREIFYSFAATLFVLSLIIIGNTFVRLLSRVSSGVYPVDVLGKLVMLGSIGFGIKLVPVALLIGMMLAFGRLYRDHEMSALHASGVGPREFYKGVFMLVGPLVVVMSILVLFAVPKIEQELLNVTNEIKQRPESSGIPVGEFMSTKSKNKLITIFVEDVDEKNVVMKHFFMHFNDQKNEGKETIISGQKALLYIDPEKGGRIFKLEKGSRYDRNKNTGEFSIFKFSEHGIHIPVLLSNSLKSLEAVSFTTLLKNEDLTSKAEIHWRLALIISTPVMAFLAFPLSFTSPRQGRFGKLAVGILLYALYANLIMTGKSMIVDGRMPSWLGLWWVHLLFIGFSYWLVRQQYSNTR